MHRKLVGLLATPLLLGACLDDQAAAESRAAFSVRDSAGIAIVESSSPAWSRGEEWSLGSDPIFILDAFDGGELNRLLDPTSIDVDTRGRIIVGDGNQSGWHAILVYDSLGRFQFQAGREGEGPGEFRQLWWATAYRGDSLVAFDMSGDRLSVFSPEGKFVRSLRTPQLTVPPGPEGSYGYTAGADAAYLDGHFLAYPQGTLDPGGNSEPAWYRHLLLRLNPTGESWDTLGTFEISQHYWTGSSQEQLWFAPFSVSAVTHDRLYFGRGDRFELREYDSSGHLLRIIKRAHEPRPVTEELRDQMRDWYLDLLGGSSEMNDQLLEQVRAQMEAARFTDFLPAYSALLFDPSGYLWVEEFRWMLPNERSPITSPAEWSVFALGGEWLGNVQTPAGFILRKVTKARAYGFVIDELGVKQVHAYSLER